MKVLILFLLFSCASKEKELRSHRFFNPILEEIVKVKYDEEKKYCFRVKNNSTASISYDVCGEDLEKIKSCYLKFSTLQRSLRGLKERKVWNRYKPPYLVILKRRNKSADKLVENFESCQLIKNEEFLYNKQ